MIPTIHTNPFDHDGNDPSDDFNHQTENTMDLSYGYQQDTENDDKFVKVPGLPHVIHCLPALISSTATELSSELSLSHSLFPPNLSNWISDEEGNFRHDSSSKSDTEVQIHQNLNTNTFYNQLVKIAMGALDRLDSNQLSHTPSDIPEETMTLLPKNTEDHPNTYHATSTTIVCENKIAIDSICHAIQSENSITEHLVKIENQNVNELENQSQLASQSPQSNRVVTPVTQAITTWLSPYAAAKRVGKMLHLLPQKLSFEEKSVHEINQPKELQFDHDTNDSPSTSHNLEKDEDIQQTSSIYERGNTINQPLIIGMDSNSALEQRWNDHDTIVLREIEHGEHTDDDGTVVHPWTKLILLEELGTTSSWFVLLLPYAFMLLALFLDGNFRFKNAVVGPRRSDHHCTDFVRGKVPEPFGMSIDGFFPVPFTYTEMHAEYSSIVNEACTYPYELREGVGLLSNGIDPLNASTSPSSTSSFVRPSIVDGRYRHLMSHGYAFTSGVIPHFPATSLCLLGTVQFNNLSSRAVALVADSSVLISTIIFQRLSSATESSNITTVSGIENNNTTQHEWSPVLILTPKRLDLRCKVNNISSSNFRYNRTTVSNSYTWNCVGKIIEAFFSLPNTALLIGGELRTDTLLSYSKQHNSLSDDSWFNEKSGMAGSDDYYTQKSVHDDFSQLVEDELLLNADLSKHNEILAELAEKSVLTLSHESEAYNLVFEETRIVAMLITFGFMCYWCWSMGHNLDTESSAINESMATTSGGNSSFMWQLRRRVSLSSRKCNDNQSIFWWESPWVTFPERRYLLMVMCCLLLLQNPLITYAFFNPSLYSNATFRCAADSLSGISVHGILFLWLCLMHGLRYHTADFSRRRFDQHRRVMELQEATKHLSQPCTLENDRWGRVSRYYKQYGDVDGAGAFTSALRLKHDINSDSFVEFIFPKLMLLLVGIVSTITAAVSRFPSSDPGRRNSTKNAFLNPDHFGGKSQVYVVSSVVQLLVIQLWGILIVYASFITGERLRREPFLSTRPAQLAFRVLSGILLLGVAFSLSLFFSHTLDLLGTYDNKGTTSSYDDDHDHDDDFVYDTSIGSRGESWNSKADFLFGMLRRASVQVPYVDTSFNIGPGKILYATVCSLVISYIFLPSSHFHPSNKMHEKEANETTGVTGYSKKNMLLEKDRRLQRKDKRFVVTLARNTHTWRVFPQPIRSHGLISQHTIKETLNFVGTFQLDGSYNIHKFKHGRGAIFKGKYIPVFCVETACWLLEASWQSYYSPIEYSFNDWAPGKMSLDSIGLKLERAIVDNETDTHAYVATNTSNQTEGEEDSIIVVSFRGTASISNMRTDLSFRQVPLPGKIVADIPSFRIQPEKGIVIEENAWHIEKTPTSIMRDILSPSMNKYASWPTTTTETTCSRTETFDQTSLILPAVSDGAKALIRATPMARQALPCVHEGFLLNYSKVRQEIIETILSVLKRQVDKSVERCRQGERFGHNSNTQPLTLPKIYITGHSLGGSLAQLLALDLASNCEIVMEQQGAINNDGGPLGLSSKDLDLEEYWLGHQHLRHQKGSSNNIIRIHPPIAVYTYGQPRVGNLAFKMIYKHRVPHSFRVVTEGDAFTAMPSFGPCFGGIYRHAGLEVLLDEGCTGNILVGPTVVETLFRFTKVRTSVANHSIVKYRDSLESAFGRDALKEYYRGHGGKVNHSDRWRNSSNLSSLPSWVTSVGRPNEERHW